jgi:oligopeptide/dipeptide ABC transporter ATP-binding protein
MSPSSTASACAPPSTVSISFRRARRRSSALWRPRARRAPAAHHRRRAGSALDASIQAQIINLFEELRESLGIAFIFIAHDLNVVRHISHRVAVMYLGHIVETAPAAELFDRPRHPYTRALLSAIPAPDPAQRTASASLEGELPDPLHPPPGCSFSTRCAWAEPACQGSSAGTGGAGRGP